jgi:putative glutamine amidotransferase
MAGRAANPHPGGTMPRRRPRTAAPPLIGVVTHELREDRAPAWAATPGRRERDLAPARLALRLSYTQALQEAGAIAVVLPAHGFVDDVDALLDRVDGLLVSGGPDLDPGVYGQAPHPALGPDVDRVADEYEQALLVAAAARDLPLLGICRGLQALNVSRGGTLHQHLPAVTDGSVEHRQTASGRMPTHTVRIEPGSRLAEIVGTEELHVNSFHHQAVDRLGRGLRAVAWSPDGVVEAIEETDTGLLLGVQWHAETLVEGPAHARLFEALVAASRPAERRAA